MEALRFVCASILILLIPGYAMTLALFPEAGKIDPLERFFIAISTSAAISSLVGVGLLKGRIILEPRNFSLILLTITAIFLSVAWARVKRRNDLALKRYFSKEHIKQTFRPIWLFLALAFILSILSANSLIPIHPAHLTEFYVSPGWLEESGHLIIKKPVTSVPVEIHNLEANTMRYQIKAFFDDTPVWESQSIILDHQSTHTEVIPVSSYNPNSAHLLVIYLYKDASENPAASLRLSIEPDKTGK